MKTIKINFYLDVERINASGLCPIKVRSRHNSSRLIKYSTGEFCEPSQWDKRKKLPKDAQQKNILNGLELKIKDTYKDLVKSSPDATLEDVWNKIKPTEQVREAPKSQKIVDWIDHYLATSPYSPGYTRGVKLLSAHLSGKFRWRGKKMKIMKAFDPGLRFDQLTQTKVDAFCKHLVDQGKSTSTVLKAIKFLKQLSKLAQDEGMKVGTLNFKAPKNYQRKVRTEIRLTLDEILKIQSAYTKDEYQKIVKDLFLLQCFTGLRHVDLMKLTPENIHEEYIEVRQQKTGEYVFPTLHKYSKPILNSYLSKAKDNYSALFPQLSQQYYNKAIKLIGKAAGLKEVVRQISYQGPSEQVLDAPKFELITSHTGRRSFARMLSQMGLDEQIIAEELGHNTRSITAHYVGGLDHQQRIREVQQAWESAKKIFSKPLMNVA